MSQEEQVDKLLMRLLTSVSLFADLNRAELVTVLYISHKALKSQAQLELALYRNMARMLARRLRQTNEALRDLSDGGFERAAGQNQKQENGNRAGGDNTAPAKVESKNATD